MSTHTTLVQTKLVQNAYDELVYRTSIYVQYNDLKTTQNDATFMEYIKPYYDHLVTTIAENPLCDKIVVADVLKKISQLDIIHTRNMDNVYGKTWVVLPKMDSTVYLMIAWLFVVLFVLFYVFSFL